MVPTGYEAGREGQGQIGFHGEDKILILVRS
jgi:hypothetical protein